MSNMMRYSAELVSLLAFFFVCLLIITKEYNIFALIENIKTNEKFNSYPHFCGFNCCPRRTFICRMY